MSILNKKDRVANYRYMLKQFTIVYSNGDTKNLDWAHVGSIYIANDYMGNVFPIIKVTLSIESSVYYKILRDKENIKFKIRLQKFYQKIYGNSEKSLLDDYINDTFSLILDDDKEDLSKKSRKRAYPRGEEDQLNAQSNNVDFYLFKTETIKKSKKNVNVILENSNITNAIAYIATDIGIDNILMSKADNDTIYDRILIPPMKAIQSFAYLDTYYGIHKEGSIIYFDIDRNYILKYSGKCTAYEKNEMQETIIYVPRQGGELYDKHGSLIKYIYKKENDKYVKDDTRYHIIGNFESFDVQNETISDSVIYGNDADIIDIDTGDINRTGGSKSSTVQTIENIGENKYFNNIFKIQRDSKSRIISITFNNIDLSAIKPNKKYNFVFEDSDLSKKYKGTYILCSANIGLVKSEKYLKSMVECKFRQI